MPSSSWNSRLSVRALAPIRLPELGQRGVVRGVLVQHPGDGPQPVVVWLGQLQWLLVCLVEFVDEDPVQAGAGARGRRCARAGEGEQDFAGEAGGQ